MRKKELLKINKELLEMNRRLQEQIKEMFRTNLQLVTAAGIAEGTMDVALKDIRALGRMGQNICPVCAHYNHGEGSKKCITCPKMDNFEWRGLVKEGENK